MEAIPQFAYTAQNPDELSFTKNDVVKVMKEVDEHWCMAELRGMEGMIPKNYIQKKDCGWFAGKISRKEAEEKLMKENYDGAFLIRISESNPNDFSLSVRYNDAVQHFKVLRDGAGKYFLWVTKFDSLNQLVEYHKTTSVTREKSDILLHDPNATAKKSVHTVAGQPEKLVRAMYDFNPQPGCKDELPMKKGDIVVLIAEADKNWWKGRNKSSNKEGLFPANHVQVIK